MSNNEFDYIIVGAGSSGCALAEGLSADGKNQVCVIEAGGSNRNFFIKMPIGYGRIFFDKKVNWMYQTETEPNLDNRSIYWPRGKVLGGSSSINALVYCRGQKTDFEDWVHAGAKGWGWDTVRACYNSFENPIDSLGNRTGHGGMTIKDTRNDIHKSNQRYFEMAREMGIPVINDFNGDDPREGISHYRITTNKGFRNSSADAFLGPARKRSNVTVITHAEVDRILFDGTTATGIQFRENGNFIRIKARREVIISAGSVNSPKLLQLSGIGPGQVLQENGIDPVFINDNVGGNLQDHLGINYYYRASEPTINNQLSPWWGKLLQGARYILTRKGPLSLGINQCGGFIRSRDGLRAPDQQLYLNPVSYTTVPEGTRSVINPDPWPGFILCFQPCRPSSRGRIDIASPDPSEAPKIVPNYLSTDKDIEDVIAGGHLIQRMAKTQTIQKFSTEATAPDILTLDDEAIVEDFRKRCSTVFHPTSTCRMGADAQTAVVDPDLKVFGVDSLRVVDASVFPNLTSGNTNAPSLMVGRQAAMIILSGK